MKRYFVTGTDTDCGKTYATAELIAHFPNSVAIKPVASGCITIGDSLVSSDAMELVKNNGLGVAEINPWRFELPVSPHIAAEKEGQLINLSELVEYCMQFELPGMELLFIEGAGGLMVPLNTKHTWLDFLKASGITVIVVVGMKLGCINHALLTTGILQAHNIPCAGWIANCIDPEMLVIKENIDTLISRLNVPFLGLIPYNGQLEAKKMLS